MPVRSNTVGLFIRYRCPASISAPAMGLLPSSQQFLDYTSCNLAYLLCHSTKRVLYIPNSYTYGILLDALSLEPFYDMLRSAHNGCPTIYIPPMGSVACGYRQISYACSPRLLSITAWVTMRTSLPALSRKHPLRR